MIVCTALGTLGNCTSFGLIKHAAVCRSSRPDDMTPPDGEATAPDFEKNLEKDPHEAKIPEFAGLNVKNQVCSRPCPLAHTWHVRRSSQRCF